MTNASPRVVAVAICALVFTLLGIAYLVVGFAGGPEAFRYLGPAFLAGGIVLGAFALPARARRCGRPSPRRRSAGGRRS